MSHQVPCAPTPTDTHPFSLLVKCEGYIIACERMTTPPTDRLHFREVVQNTKTKLTTAIWSDLKPKLQYKDGKPKKTSKREHICELHFTKRGGVCTHFVRSAGPSPAASPECRDLSALNNQNAPICCVSEKYTYLFKQHKPPHHQRLVACLRARTNTKSLPQANPAPCLASIQTRKKKQRLTDTQNIKPTRAGDKSAVCNLLTCRGTPILCSKAGTRGWNLPTAVAIFCNKTGSECYGRVLTECNICVQELVPPNRPTRPWLRGTENACSTPPLPN